MQLPCPCRLQGRARMKSGSRSAGGVLATNPRAGYRPLPTPPPGDPSLSGLARADMTWTIQADEAAMLTAVPVEADDLAWAMVWREADKQGNISVPRCKALNINDGACGPGQGQGRGEGGGGGPGVVGEGEWKGEGCLGTDLHSMVMVATACTGWSAHSICSSARV
jgi:hypothetical protein